MISNAILVKMSPSNFSQDYKKIESLGRVQFIFFQKFTTAREKPFDYFIVNNLSLIL